MAVRITQNSYSVEFYEIGVLSGKGKTYPPLPLHAHTLDAGTDPSFVKDWLGHPLIGLTETQEFLRRILMSLLLLRDVLGQGTGWTLEYQAYKAPL